MRRKPYADSALRGLCTLRAWESEEYCKTRLGLEAAPLGRIDPAKALQQRGGGRCLISICTADGMGVVAILER